jgi:hypothetical protein
MFNEFSYLYAAANVPQHLSPIKETCKHTQSKFPNMCTSEVTGVHMFINFLLQMAELLTTYTHGPYSVMWIIVNRTHEGVAKQNNKTPMHSMQFDEHIWMTLQFTINTVCVGFTGTTGRGRREQMTVEVQQWQGTRHRLRTVISCEIW